MEYIHLRKVSGKPIFQRLAEVGRVTIILTLSDTENILFVKWWNGLLRPELTGDFLKKEKVLYLIHGNILITATFYQNILAAMCKFGIKLKWCPVLLD